jgi:hypothetical protein
MVSGADGSYEAQNIVSGDRLYVLLAAAPGYGGLYVTLDALDGNDLIYDPLLTKLPPPGPSPLADAYYGDLGRFARRYLGQREDAEDALQETFLRAYRSLGAYVEREAFRSTAPRQAGSVRNGEPESASGITGSFLLMVFGAAAVAENGQPWCSTREDGGGTLRYEDRRGAPDLAARG